jgi:hypothetical protein
MAAGSFRPLEDGHVVCASEQVRGAEAADARSYDGDAHEPLIRRGAEIGSPARGTSVRRVP